MRQRLKLSQISQNLPESSKTSQNSSKYSRTFQNLSPLCTIHQSYTITKSPEWLQSGQIGSPVSESIVIQAEQTGLSHRKQTSPFSKGSPQQTHSPLYCGSSPTKLDESLSSGSRPRSLFSSSNMLLFRPKMVFLTIPIEISMMGG